MKKLIELKRKKTAGAREKIAPVVFLICAGDKSKSMFARNVGDGCDNLKKPKNVFFIIWGKGGFVCLDVCLNRLYACI